MNVSVGPIAAAILFKYSHVKKRNYPEIADTIESYAIPILNLTKNEKFQGVYTWNDYNLRIEQSALTVLLL